jgi:hypothetical protein
LAQGHRKKGTIESYFGMQNDTYRLSVPPSTKNDWHKKQQEVEFLKTGIPV